MWATLVRWHEFIEEKTKPWELQIIAIEISEQFAVFVRHAQFLALGIRIYPADSINYVVLDFSNPGKEAVAAIPLLRDAVITLVDGIALLE